MRGVSIALHRRIERSEMDWPHRLESRNSRIDFLWRAELSALMAKRHIQERFREFRV